MAFEANGKADQPQSQLQTDAQKRLRARSEDHQHLEKPEENGQDQQRPMCPMEPGFQGGVIHVSQSRQSG